MKTLSPVKIGLAITAVTALVGAAVVWWVRSGNDAPAVADSTAAETRPSQPSKSKKSVKSAKNASPKSLGGKESPSVCLSDEEEGKTLSPAEQKLMDDLQDSLDKEDFKTVQRLSKQAEKSRNPKIIQRAVEACKWFGPKSLPELTALAAACADLAMNPASGAARGASEEELAQVKESADEAMQDAFGAIEETLGAVESDAEKAALVSQYMKATSDEDMLSLLEGQLNTVLDEQLAVSAAVDVITTGSGKAVEHAKEVYRFQTGEDYVSPEAADKWLQENYTPPDVE